MNKEMPHSYYPRLQLERNSFFCLNGRWLFGINTEEKTPVFDSEITVPFSPESYLSGVGRLIKKGEYMHYQKTFTLPEGFVKNRVFLHFGAVDQECRVYLNGSLLGENLGGYIPFSFDITEKLSTGENTLYLCVKDDLDPKYPYGKQKKKRGGMWYTPVSGIWQTVWIESVPEGYIEAIKITPTLSSVKIEITGGKKEKTVTVEETGKCYSFFENSIEIEIDEPRLWTPEEPNLYHITVKSGEDCVKSYFALRTVTVKEVDGYPRICLNGKPYIINGLLDQGYYPDGIFLPATEEGYLDDILMTKRLGFNMLRKHIKIEPDIFYYLCDKEGVLVLQDMVNNSDYSFFRDTALPTVGLQRLSDKSMHKNAISRKIFEDTMQKTIKLLYNHPSVIYYTIFNEGWGQFNSDEMYEKAKALDATRIFDSTSGWFRQKKSDVDSRHVYFKKLKIKDKDNRPLVISEFGGYSYRVEGHLFGNENYGYKLFESQSDFENAVIALYENEVIPLINEGACLFVYTQVSDVEDETNGFVTYDREVIKVNEERMRMVMKKVKL